MAKRISAKEALEEIINIKNEIIYNKRIEKYQNVNKIDLAMNKSTIKNYS